ncbi:MAG: trigger factor [Patescibacteria group bacterium]
MKEHNHHNHDHHDHNNHNHSYKDEKLFENINVSKLPKSEISIAGSISTKALELFKTEALNHFKKEVDLPGFRKGMVPEKIILEKVGELAILERAGEIALQRSCSEILLESKIEPLGNPQISITKLAIGNPMEFKITVAIFPQFDLPDYKNIAKKSSVKGKIEITDKEIEDTINTVRKMSLKKLPSEVISDKDLPELNDDFVKTIGNFENVEDFKKKLTENIKKEKELKNKEKNRLSIIKAVIEKTEIEVPEVIVEGELDRMIGQMKDDVTRMNLNFPDYLKKINKSEIDLRKEWEKDATERAKMELILDAIGRVEKIVSTDEEVDKEVKHLEEHYKDTDKVRATSYFRHVIKNEKVFEFLEGNLQ